MGEGEPGTSRVALRDVARAAGVSLSTASRALADDPRISRQTRAAVRAAADDLRYVINAAASSLRSKTSRTLGLLLADLSDPVHGQIASGFESEAGEFGYRVIFAAGMADAGRERKALRTFAEHSADGIALISSVMDLAEAQTLAPDRPIVIVQSDSDAVPRGRGALPAGVIVTDDEAGMTAIVEHLVGIGCRDIAYAGDGRRATDLRRHESAEIALRQRGIDSPLRRFVAPDDVWTNCLSVARSVAMDPPSALICYDDKLALGMLDAFRTLGVRVPDDIAVVGFDGIPFAALSNPRLTTVETPTDQLGRRAARALIRAAEDGTPPASALLPVRLVVRESSVALRSSPALSGRSPPANPGMRAA